MTVQETFPTRFNDYGFFWDEGMFNRMNERAKRIFDPRFDHIKGKTILDLGARDGRWSWAAHNLGARRTVGVEGRQESADKGKRLMAGLDHQFVIGNVFDILPAMVEKGQTFDTVLCLGFYYHIYDHYGLLKLMDALKPRHIVIDSEMDNSRDAFVRVRKEKTFHPNNAIPEIAGQQFSAVGNISLGAMDMIAECFGYKVHWSDWSKPPSTKGLDDYMAPSRFTCILSKV